MTNGFFKGMVLGAVTGVAADLALRTATGKRTWAGQTMQKVTDAVDSAALSVTQRMEK